MPFTLIKTGPSKGKYRSPSGRVWTKKQVKKYHAKGSGKRRGKK